MKKILLLFAVLFAFGCQSFEDLRAPEDFRHLPRTWENVFEGFWTGMNNNYVFWNIDPTDWDQAYKDFQPRFAALDRLGFFDRNIPLARQLFTELTQDLIDGHFALFLEGDAQGAIFSAANRASREEATEGVWISRTIVENYLAQSMSYTVPVGATDEWPSESGRDFDGFSAIVGKIPFRENSSDSILYFRFTNFYWTAIISSWRGPHRDALVEIFNFFARNLHSSNTRGVIVDLRGNTGGFVSDFDLIWGQMFSAQSHKIGYILQKIGDNRLDFGPHIPFNIYGHTQSRRDLDVPLALLVNNFSVSASEISALFVRSFDNGFIVGSPTWGGLGGLTENRVFNSGQFSTLGIELSYTASFQTLDLNRKSWEGIGVQPDFHVPFSEMLFFQGIDGRLEKALEIIRGN